MIKGKDYELVDGHLKIFECVTTIDELEFVDKKISSVEIPSGVTSIGAQAFEYNELTSLKIGNGVTFVGKFAFRNNFLVSVEIPNSVKSIDVSAFENNLITNLKLGNGVISIGDTAFEDNQLTSVEIPDSVISIGTFAFKNNELTSIKIGNGVIDIGAHAFGYNQLASVEIPNSVVNIGAAAFKNNVLTSLKLGNNVKYIRLQTFMSNKLVNVDIPNNVTNIGDSAFENNEITNLKLGNSVTSIGSQAFRFNKLTSVKLSNSLRTIGNGAFLNNKLTSIEIPDSVTLIGKDAFDCIDIIYNGVSISKNFVERYGCENIIKLYKASKIIPLEEIYINISKNILAEIPITNDAIKGYILNKKHFEEIIGDKQIKDEEYKDIFKMCFTLGLFSNPSDDIKYIIKQIIEEKDLDYIHQMWTAVKLTTYKPKFKTLFMKLYNEGKTDYEGQNIIGRLYSSFEKINKYTIKRHEEEISKKNAEIKRLKELGANTIFLEQELEILKKTKKNIEYEDITYYIKNNAFDIREGNEELKSVVDTLSVHMEQEDFDIIQDMYEESLEVEKTIPLTKDTSDKDFKYHWSKSDNPINTILGYIVDCCAKLGGAGEDIMRQSMINPDVANLIIYDENNNIIGKATAYYNRSKKYILFNNAETKEIGSKGLKSAEQRQKECLEALIRGAMDATCALKERGEDISEVRIGMLRNDLESAIKDYGLKISHELLKSYNWQGYAGDASDIEKGQAIIYKDEEVYNKNKDHI